MPKHAVVFSKLLRFALTTSRDILVCRIGPCLFVHHFFPSLPFHTHSATAWKALWFTNLFQRDLYSAQYHHWASVLCGCSSQNHPQYLGRTHKALHCRSCSILLLGTLVFNIELNVFFVTFQLSPSKRSLCGAVIYCIGCHRRELLRSIPLVWVDEISNHSVLSIVLLDSVSDHPCQLTWNNSFRHDDFLSPHSNLNDDWSESGQ